MAVEGQSSRRLQVNIRHFKIILGKAGIRLFGLLMVSAETTLRPLEEAFNHIDFVLNLAF